MNPDDKPATKSDVIDAIKEITPGIVQEIVTDATDNILTAVGDQLNVVNNRIDELDDKLTDKIEGLERKVDTVLDDHEVRITKLENQQA